MNAWVREFLQRLGHRPRIGADRRGVSAVEFALIAPVMVILLLGSVEVSFMMQTDRKVTQASNALGDLVAQDTEIRAAEMTDIFQAARAILEPNPLTSAKLRVTSLVDAGGNKGEVEWSRGQNWAGRAVGSEITLPAGLMPANGSLIMSEMEYSYHSMFNEIAAGTTVLKDTFYLRPRRSNKVVYVP